MIWKVLKHCLSIYVFIYLSSVITGKTPLYCRHSNPSHHLQQYDNETHICHGGRVIPREVATPKTPPIRTQAQPLVHRQNPVTAAPAHALPTTRLEPGRHTAAPSPTTPAHVSTPTPKHIQSKYPAKQHQPPTAPQVPANVADVLVTPRPKPWDTWLCAGGLWDELHCGLERYRPANQTCCQGMEYEWKIFQQPEKSNVCCRSNVGYTLHPRRLGEIPCIHPGLNDPIFRPLPVKYLGNKYKLCPTLTFKYAYRLTVKRETSDGSSYKLTFKQIQFNNDYKTISTGEKLSKTMPIDRYSPRKRLTGRSILVLSHVDKANDIDFNLHTGDVIVKVRGRSKKSMKKTFRKVLKLMRNC